MSLRRIILLLMATFSQLLLFVMVYKGKNLAVCPAFFSKKKVK